MSGSYFGLELPEPIRLVARRIEALSGQPIQVHDKMPEDQVGRVAGYFVRGSGPQLARPGKKTKVTVEEVTIEILRLQHRNRTTEERLPYADMRHLGNRRLCRWLYRVMEQEILFAVAQTHGVDVRQWWQGRLKSEFMEPLEEDEFLADTDEIERRRTGTLMGLDLLVSHVDRHEALQQLCKVADHDEGIAAQLGLLYKVVENNRPFDEVRRVRAAYYLSVPFLFDTRKRGRSGASAR